MYGWLITCTQIHVKGSINSHTLLWNVDTNSCERFNTFTKDCMGDSLHSHKLMWKFNRFTSMHVNTRYIHMNFCGRFNTFTWICVKCSIQSHKFGWLITFTRIYMKYSINSHTVDISTEIRMEYSIHSHEFVWKIQYIHTSITSKQVDLLSFIKIIFMNIAAF